MVQAHAHTLLIACAVGCADPAPPHLADVTPGAVAPNGIVTVVGSGLCGPSADCSRATGEFRLDSDMPVRALVLSYLDVSAELQIPSLTPIGTVSIVLVVDDVASNELSLEIIEP